MGAKSSVICFLDCLSIWSLLLGENTLKVSTSSHFVYPAHLLKVTVLLLSSSDFIPSLLLFSFCLLHLYKEVTALSPVSPTPFLFPVGTCTSSVSIIRSFCVSITSVKTPINSFYFCLKEVYLSGFFFF